MGCARASLLYRIWSSLSHYGKCAALHKGLAWRQCESMPILAFSGLPLIVHL